MIQESSKDPYHAMKIRIENFGESDLRRFANSISEVVRVSNGSFHALASKSFFKAAYRSVALKKK